MQVELLVDFELELVDVNPNVAQGVEVCTEGALTFPAILRWRPADQGPTTGIGGSLVEAILIGIEDRAPHSSVLPCGMKVLFEGMFALKLVDSSASKTCSGRVLWQMWDAIVLVPVGTIGLQSLTAPGMR